MCEEVHQPAVEVPKAIVGGVMLNFLVGLCTLIPIAFVLPDIAMLANLPSGQPVPVILKSATGNSAGAFCLTIPLIVLGLICGVSCVTSASRCTWAFARDGAIPGSKWFKQIDPRFEVPLNAIALGMAVELLLGLIYFGSTAAFNAFSGAGVIFLTVSYACPVAVSFILRRREVIKQGSFDLGPLGGFCNIVCLCMSIHLTYHLNSFGSDTQLLMPCRLDSPRHPTVLHADIQGSYTRNHELCFCCFRGLCPCLRRLVLDLGP